MSSDRRRGWARSGWMAWSMAVALAGPVSASGNPAATEQAFVDAANEARRAVEEGRPDSTARLEAAEERFESLPRSSARRPSLALHLLRTRMLAGVAGTGIRARLEQVVEDARRHGDDAARAWGHRYLAEIAADAGDPGRARAELDRVLLVAESDATWEARVDGDAFRERRLLGPDDGEEAIAVLSRARATLARLRPRLDEALFLERARPVHERLVARLLDRTIGHDVAVSGADASAEVDAQLREVLALLEALKQAELRAYFGDPCLADLETTTPERIPGTLLLYPVLLEDRVELIVGRAGRLERIPAPIDPAELVRESRRLRGALQDPTSPRHRTPASRLYDALIRPIGRVEGGDATLVFVPSGALREIPVAALFDARARLYLTEQIAVATLPSLHILPPRALDGRRTQLLAAGLTRAVEDFPALPFAGRELDAAAERFPAVRRIDDGFSRAGFAAAFEERPFDVVHVASHGRFDARASESFLLARDGRIGFAELADWIGRTRLRTGRPLELLVLSACETAVGDERAVLGLAGVAVQAGARSAVASLWKVHDEATMTLFAAFYRELGRPDVSRAEALRRAQRVLLAEPRFRHPIFWSAFVLVNGWL